MDKWIPISRELPKEDGRYICTYEYQFGKCVDFGKFEKGEWFVGGVIAWMPLPEPYDETKDHCSPKCTDYDYCEYCDFANVCENCKA